MHADVDKALHGFELALHGQRADTVALLRRLDDLDLRARGNGYGDRVVVNRSFNQHARGRIATLAGVAKATHDAQRD